MLARPEKYQPFAGSPVEARRSVVAPDQKSLEQ
jgi:hypothetical protein